MFHSSHSNICLNSLKLIIPQVFQNGNSHMITKLDYLDIFPNLFWFGYNLVTEGLLSLVIKFFGVLVENY